ncbi:MAG: hypothetical protein ABIH20_01700 [Candidatus Diapherotrites archaeon]
MKETNILIFIIAIGLIGFFIGGLFGPFFHQDMNMENMSTDEKRTEFIELKESIQGDLMPNTKYRCCLEKACTYCIEKTPGHGEGAICDCLADLMNGVHPCGECIGEILEGHGNPLLAEYFARAIAEKVGEEHKDTLKQIIFEKYEFPIEDQL